MPTLSPVCVGPCIITAEVSSYVTGEHTNQPLKHKNPQPKHTTKTMQRIKNAIKLVGIGMLLCACSGNLEIPSRSKTARNLQQQRTTQLYSTALVRGSASDKEPPGGSGSGGGGNPSSTPYAATDRQHGNTGAPHAAPQPEGPNTPQPTEAKQPQPAKNNPPAGGIPQSTKATPSGKENVDPKDDNAESKVNAAQQQPNAAAGGGAPQPTPTPNRQNDAAKNTDPAQQPTTPEVTTKGGAPNPDTAEDQKKTEDAESERAKKADNDQTKEDLGDGREGMNPTIDVNKIPGESGKKPCHCRQHSAPSVLTNDKEDKEVKINPMRKIEVGEIQIGKLTIVLIGKNNKPLRVPNGKKVNPNDIDRVAIIVKAKKETYEVEIDGAKQIWEQPIKNMKQFRIDYTIPQKKQKVMIRVTMNVNKKEQVVDICKISLSPSRK